ncbi:hypothetical protein E2562_001662 [Oryza meyeriana var. granulata]|uniref:Secreted protein n=1 Tax=Oryza meyeriana var. granulata TaxID=110450 RepID=A0A6G1CCP8_9ORYZ|nr:hypothetical protein E2562_001662 [Oryza meyeriana var. granulata]
MTIGSTVTVATVLFVFAALTRSAPRSRARSSGKGLRYTAAPCSIHGPGVTRSRPGDIQICSKRPATASELLP